MVYCIVPGGVSGKVRRSVERALRAHEEVATLAERRRADRRMRAERRLHDAARPAWAERRRVRYPDGRRVAERRATLVPVGVPDAMPRAVRQYAAALTFFAPLEIPHELRSDVDAVRALVRFQSGEQEVAELYRRWFDPVYTYLSLTLERGADVESHVATALAAALEAASEAAPAPAQVRAWLFGIAYDTVRADAGAARRPLNGHRHERAEPPVDDGEAVLKWVTDEDLLLLIGRRPAQERHVLVLHYFAGLSFDEIAEVLRIHPAGAAELHRSAVEALDATLAAVAPGARGEERHQMGRLTHQTPVLHRRRRALLAV